MMALPSDEFLLSAFARGDRDAFDRLTAPVRSDGARHGTFGRTAPMQFGETYALTLSPSRRERQRATERP